MIVEAEAVMMNGAVQGMCGTAGLALAAATHDTPFIVLCHTYKFCNNDLTDSLVFNELGEYKCELMFYVVSVLVAVFLAAPYSLCCLDKKRLTHTLLGLTGSSSEKYF